MNAIIEVERGMCQHGMTRYTVHITRDGERHYIGVSRMPAEARRIASDMVDVYRENGHTARIVEIAM
jgi:hypothetical protein